ncbi:MAG: cytochrome-c peroxidase, partial [Chitinophagaceae bacterium]
SIGVNGHGLSEKRKFPAKNDIPFTKRNSQTILNTAYNGINENGNYSPENAPMFWDLRAKGLEEQALLPIKTFEEMRGHGFNEELIAGEIERRINSIPQYKKLFRDVFGEGAITAVHVSKALASFQRSLVANNSRFDKYMRGDKSAMSTREIEGMQLFINTGCARCHNGPMLSDYKIHVLGVADNELLAVPDSGFQNKYGFRTPSLMNLRLTRPYMHNGKINQLKEVMTFYEDLPGKDVPNKNVTKEQVDTLARMLKLDFKNINTILEFLTTLNDDKYDRKVPTSVPSGLPVGGKIK